MAVTKQKNGKWLCHINKKGLKRVRKIFDTQAEAVNFEREYNLGLRKAPVEIDDPRTMIDLIDVWYKYHGINLAQKERLKNQLQAAAIDMGNPIGHQLTPEMIVQLRYERTVTNERTITQKTFNNIHSGISAMYNTLKKLRIIDYENPIGELDKLRIQERQLIYLSKGQIKDLLNSIKDGCQNESTWFVANLCLRTGSRWGETELLTRKQLHNKMVTYEFTKGKKTRTIPIAPDFYKELLQFCRDKEPADRIFSNCYNSFRKAVKRAGVSLPDGQLTHVLRHTFASHFMMNSGNILTLRDILGHSDIKMTMRYAHLAPNHLQDALKLNPITKL